MFFFTKIPFTKHRIHLSQTHRYKLFRVVDPQANPSCDCGGGAACKINPKQNIDCLKWVLFNPSYSPTTPTLGFKDDKTVQNVMKITARCGFSRLELYNLIPIVDPSPKNLLQKSRDKKFCRLFGFPKFFRYTPLDCQYRVLKNLRGTDPVVFAWGALKSKAPWAFLTGLEYLQCIFPAGGNNPTFYFLNTNTTGGGHPTHAHPRVKGLTKKTAFDQFNFQTYLKDELNR